MCDRGELHTELDLGTAAYCVESPTTAAASRAIRKHPFRLGACPKCGVIQLLDLPLLTALQPPDQAILYRDPERHLDDLARVTASLLVAPNALVMGMSYKDVPLLERLHSLGCTNQRVLDRTEDWQFTDPRAGIETMQARCTVAWANNIRDKYGPVGLLVVRHVLEHAHRPSEFLAACRRLTEPNGWVLFEVPGCETEFARGDTGALWEEHVSYFTSESLRRALAVHGFHSYLVGNYPYSVEDCLAVVGRFGSSSAFDNEPQSSLLKELDTAQARLRTAVLRIAQQERQRGKGLAVYGAGHRTATWLELAGLSEFVTCVIDDNPEKQGRFLAGSAVEVGPAAWLVERQIGVCIGLLSPDVLRKIAARETRFTASGGRMLTLDDVLAVASRS
jgi:hypothetical protein